MNLCWGCGESVEGAACMREHGAGMLRLGITRRMVEGFPKAGKVYPGRKAQVKRRPRRAFYRCGVCDAPMRIGPGGMDCPRCGWEPRARLVEADEEMAMAVTNA